MRILVTGHLGYIGTVLSPMLVRAGHVVTGVDCDLYRECTFGSPASLPAVKSVLKDIRDLERSDLDGFDAVMHLAALSNDPLGDLDEALTYDINERASVRLAELARSAGVSRFIFSSSCSTYGMSGDDFLDESAPSNPVTPYGMSKVRVEREVSRMASGEFSPVFLRNATAYGVSPRLRFDLVLNNLAAWAHTTGEVHLKSDGSAWRPIVHIEDISRAFIAAIESPREVIHNEAFNVGLTAENLRVGEIAHLVAAAVPGSRVGMAAGASPDKRTYRVNCDKYARTFPRHGLRWTPAAGARELLDAYARERIRLDEVEGPRYKRIAHIESLLARGILDKSLRRRAA